MERSPHKVGMLYEVIDPGHHERHRTRKGDFVIPIKHTGDCHYFWARLEETTGNEWDRYFNVDTFYSTYGCVGKEVLPEPLDSEGLLQIMISPQRGSAALLVRRPKEETDKLLERPCPLCGEKFEKFLEKELDTTNKSVL